MIKAGTEPSPDIAICSQCGWCGRISECEQNQEGDWEYGYYTLYLCPECEDGGRIDDYDMSDERLTEWQQWRKLNNEN